jgi:hypothetical protein
VARVFDQFLAGLSEVSSLTEPLDERNVEAPLQLLDLMRHGWLRQVQVLGCGGEAAPFSHLDECSELIQIEAAHDL